MSRRWFWPLVVTAVVGACIAGSLAALAIESPVPRSPLGDGTFAGDDPLLARCLGLINLFSGGGDPLDSSDAPLLLGAGVAVAASLVALRLAAAHR
jgi:hypothetical protein